MKRAPQEGGHLLPGHQVVRAELGAAAASSDARCRQAVDVAFEDARLVIGEEVTRCVTGRLERPDSGTPPSAPGDRAGRAEARSRSRR